MSDMKKTSLKLMWHNDMSAIVGPVSSIHQIAHDMLKKWPFVVTMRKSSSGCAIKIK